MKKQIVLLILSFVIIIPSYSQLKNGIYFWHDPEKKVSAEISFKENVFTYKKESELDSIHGTGKFKIKAAKLILNFDHSLYEKISAYKILDKTILTTTGRASFVDMKVFDVENDSKPFYGAFILLQGEFGNIAQFFTDSLGKIEFFIWDVNVIKSISVDFMGYERVTIPVHDLIRQKVIISCYLGLAKQQGADSSVIEYRIQDITNKGFILTDDDGHHYIFSNKPKNK